MNQQVVEGIVLHAFDFKESSRIITLFTPNLGKMNIIVKRISPKKPVLANLTTPFCQAEFIYHKGKSDLYRFIDGSIINLHLPLRSSYTILSYGAKMLRIIAQSQLPEKPAKALYQLLILYLKRLQKAPSPITLWCSFQLKVLKYEGLLSLHSNCNRCSTKKSSALLRGESLCKMCAQTESTRYSDIEWQTLVSLTHCKDFDILVSIEVEKDLEEKIENIFKENAKGGT